MAKAITLSLGYETSTTSKDEVEAILKADGVINHHRKAKKVTTTIINLSNGEWGIKAWLTKDELVQMMAKIMAGQGGPSINMDEVEEMANEIWDLH